jgi:hypothetical protein
MHNSILRTFVCCIIFAMAVWPMSLSAQNDSKTNCSKLVESVNEALKYKDCKLDIFIDTFCNSNCIVKVNRELFQCNRTRLFALNTNGIISIGNNLQYWPELEEIYLTGVIKNNSIGESMKACLKVKTVEVRMLDSSELFPTFLAHLPDSTLLNLYISSNIDTSALISQAIRFVNKTNLKRFRLSYQSDRVNKDWSFLKNRKVKRLLRITERRHISFELFGRYFNKYGNTRVL